MTTSLAQTIPCVTTITGNRVTINAETWSSTGLGTITIAAASGVSTSLLVRGDLHGVVRIPFADIDTLDGAIPVSDLASAQMLVTQAYAGALLSFVVEEIYPY